MIRIKKNIAKKTFLNALIATGLIFSSFILTSEPVKSAEKVKLIYGPFNGKVSLESLEIYAKTGEKTGEFKIYSKFLDQKSLTQLREWLSSRFESNRVEIYKFSNSPEGEKFLTDLGTAIKTHPDRNGLYAIRSSLIEAADIPGESDGWTMIEAMRNFPTEDLQINTKDLFKLKENWAKNGNQNQAAMEMFMPKANKQANAPVR